MPYTPDRGGKSIPLAHMAITRGITRLKWIFLYPDAINSGRYNAMASFSVLLTLPQVVPSGASHDSEVPIIYSPWKLQISFGMCITCASLGYMAQGHQAFSRSFSDKADSSTPGPAFWTILDVIIQVLTLLLDTCRPPVTVLTQNPSHSMQQLKL